MRTPNFRRGIQPRQGAARTLLYSRRKAEDPDRAIAVIPLEIGNQGRMSQKFLDHFAEARHPPLPDAIPAISHDNPPCPQEI